MEKRALSYTCVILLALKYIIADGGNCECGALMSFVSVRVQSNDDDVQSSLRPLLSLLPARI